MKVGDRIGYARPWLQSVTGGDPTCELWRRRGVVLELEGDFLIVQWEGCCEPHRVAVSNVATVGSFAFAHADAKGWIGHEGLGEKPRSRWRKQ